MCGCGGFNVWLWRLQCVVVVALMCGCGDFNVWLWRLQCVVVASLMCGCGGFKFELLLLLATLQNPLTSKN